MSTAEIKTLREAFAITKEALIKIASCESHHPDDVVAIARKALTRSGITPKRKPGEAYRLTMKSLTTTP
jgi:hypothetical protein